MNNLGIKPIDLVVVNLYPFGECIKEKKSLAQSVENVDIGGPTLLRASAKNYQFVTVLSSINQYSQLLQQFKDNKGAITTKKFRLDLAKEVFKLTTAYDNDIFSYLSSSSTDSEGLESRQENKKLKLSEQIVTQRNYTKQIILKYGCNPYQKPAALHSLNSNNLPFKVLNGSPGYINFLDALNSWQLVKELQETCNLPAATSFKHVSPAGASVFVPFEENELKAYELSEEQNKDLEPLEVAYLKARQADPMSSFGDFIALSSKVTLKVAKRIKKDISDGLIAPEFDEEALKLLKTKKNNKFILIQMDPLYSPNLESCSSVEFREVFGIGLSQKRNDLKIKKEKLKVVTENGELTESEKRDLLVGQICLKYTQSNSVGFIKNGQMIGIGAGQQSRIDCVKLAGKKAKIWSLRQHPKVISLKFKKQIKKQQRINARVQYIENTFNDKEKERFLNMFENNGVDIKFLSEEEEEEFLSKQNKISLVSDAFFPFRDNIDVCYNLKFKVEAIAQAGGSINDKSVTEACQEYGIKMALTGDRLFHH